jgi:predicted outer membrane repeat protein
LYPTIIDGNIGNQNDSLDNTYSLFYCQTGADFIGLSITNANSSGASNIDNSAIYSVSNELIRVMRCQLKNNYSNYRGGAISISNSGGSLFTSETLFENNRSYEQGGAIYSTGQCQVSICKFNQCRSSYGGAIKFWGIFDNRVEFSTFTLCTSDLGKGASIQAFNATVTLANCSFYGNNNVYGEFSTYDQFGQSSFNVYNSIIVNNSSTSIANVDSGNDPYNFNACITNLALTSPSSNCLVGDPLFVNPPSNLTLQSCSPAIENSISYIMPSYMATPSTQNENYRELGSFEYFAPVVTPSGTSYLYMATAFPIEPSSWQWIDCNTNTPISGETGNTFYPNQSGDYAIVAIFPSCNDTSNCESFTVSTSDIFELTNTFNIFPNPTTNNIHIQLNTIGSIEIISLDGKVIYSDSNKLNYQVDLSSYEKGVYMVRSENGTTQKFIKQ